MTNSQFCPSIIALSGMQFLVSYIFLYINLWVWLSFMGQIKDELRKASSQLVFKALSMENGGLLQSILSIVASCTLFCPRHQAYMEGFHFSSPPPPSLSYLRCFSVAFLRRQIRALVRSRTRVKLTVGVVFALKFLKMYCLVA